MKNQMKHKLFLLFTAISAIFFIGCDDNTEMLGTSIVPDGDKMEIDTGERLDIGKYQQGLSWTLY